jgi:hypothetical protein
LTDLLKEHTAHGFGLFHLKEQRKKQKLIKKKLYIALNSIDLLMYLTMGVAENGACRVHRHARWIQRMKEITIFNTSLIALDSLAVANAVSCLSDLNHVHRPGGTKPRVEKGGNLWVFPAFNLTLLSIKNFHMMSFKNSTGFSFQNEKK